MSDLRSSESNDCVVRAVAESFGVSYEKAHYFCKVKLQRMNNCGTFTQRYLPKVTQAFGKKIKQLGEKGAYSNKVMKMDCKSTVTKRVQKYKKDGQPVLIEKKIRKVVKRYMKVSDFLKVYPKGNFIVTVRRHAFSVVDGVIGGNWNDKNRLSRRVETAYQVG